MVNSAEPSLAIQIAIDGPVASGKSTVAKRLAARLGFLFLDTGALYRAVAYMALEHAASLTDEEAIVALITAGSPGVVVDPSDTLNYRISVGGKLLREELFLPDVSRAVSRVAAMPKVRHKLLNAQRAFADGRNIVMAGRDIGTVVLPQAQRKFFLTASIDTRVDRRLRQLEARGIQIAREILKTEIQNRDQRDINRAVAPLVKALDALEVDTSTMSVDAVVDALEAAVRARLQT